MAYRLGTGALRGSRRVTERSLRTRVRPQYRRYRFDADVVELWVALFRALFEGFAVSFAGWESNRR
jgi:hypothetical protein